MQFPNAVQSALLFDRSDIDLEDIHKSFVMEDLVHNNVHYKTIEDKPKTFFRLVGNNDLMVTAEFLDRPANHRVFEQALASSFTRLLFPEIQTLISRHRSHILINVSHGVQPDIMKGIKATVGLPIEGASLPQFQARLKKLAFLSVLAQKKVPATVVHWTLSNTLLNHERFRGAADFPIPGPLHIHPVLFGKPIKQGEPFICGIRTFGARHFIGRELLIMPNPIPWQATYLSMLAFLKAATAANGYVVPDGELFGPEGNAEYYRIHYRAAENGDVPLYEFEPMLHRASGFQSPA